MIIFFAGFTLSFTPYFKPVKNAVFVVIKPFSVVGNIVANRTVNLFDKLAQLSSLGKENETLIKENLSLQSELAMLKEVQHENEILKEELGLLNSNDNTLNLKPATIIGRSATGYIKTLVIDRGQKEGVKEGQAITSQGYLVGTVKKVYSDTAEVSLITDYNSLVPVLLQDSRGSGLLRGGLDGLTVEEIPLNVEIKNGEPVLTSGLGGNIPAGILVGKVNEIVSKPGELFQKVTVNSPVQIYFLEFVFVVDTGK